MTTNPEALEVVAQVEVTQADIDLAEVIMRRIKRTIETTLETTVEISHEGLDHLLAGHRTAALTAAQQAEIEAKDAEIARLEKQVVALKSGASHFVGFIGKDGEPITLKWGDNSWSGVLRSEHFDELREAHRIDNAAYQDWKARATLAGGSNNG